MEAAAAVRAVVDLVAQVMVEMVVVSEVVSVVEGGEEARRVKAAPGVAAVVATAAAMVGFVI